MLTDVVRMCSPTHTEDDCDTRHTRTKGHVKTRRYNCACNTDLCNGSGSAFSSMPVLLSMLLLLLFSKYECMMI